MTYFFVALFGFLTGLLLAFLLGMAGRGREEEERAYLNNRISAMRDMLEVSMAERRRLRAELTKLRQIPVQYYTLTLGVWYPLGVRTRRNVP